MRKSFKLIVFISISAILSLVLALFIAPLRSSFGEYSTNMKAKVFNAVNVNLTGANNGIGAVNTDRVESTIEVGSIKSGKKKTATSKNNTAVNSELSGISYTLQAYAQRKQLGNSIGGGLSAGSGVLANSSIGNTSNGIQGSLGLNSTPSKNNTTINGPALIGFNTLSTDLNSADLATAQGGGPQGAGGPPPEEGGGGPGPTLPIGDGTGLLLAMALAFVSLKAFRIKVA